MLKVVIDSNVWISSLLSDGNSRKIRNRFEQAEFRLFCAEELLTECAAILARPKFASRIDPEQARNNLHQIDEAIPISRTHFSLSEKPGT